MELISRQLQARRGKSVRVTREPAEFTDVQPIAKKRRCGLPVEHRCLAFSMKCFGPRTAEAGLDRKGPRRARQRLINPPTTNTFMVGRLARVVPENRPEQLRTSNAAADFPHCALRSPAFTKSIHQTHEAVTYDEALCQNTRDGTPDHYGIRFAIPGRAPLSMARRKTVELSAMN
jgi:hypothetical protein